MTQTVRTFAGCIVSSEKVADYLIGTVSPTHADFANGFTMTDEQFAIVDSILLDRPGLNLLARTWMLEALEPSPENYARLRQLVEGEDVTDAVPALARHRRPDDVSILLRTIRSQDRDRQYDGFTAAAENPADLLYPILVNEFRRMREEKKEMYGEFQKLCIALAKYDRPEVTTMFREALSEHDQLRRSEATIAIAVALRLSPHTAFSILGQSITLNESETRGVEWAMEYETSDGPTRRRP